MPYWAHKRIRLALCVCPIVYIMEYIYIMECMYMGVLERNLSN